MRDQALKRIWRDIDSGKRASEAAAYRHALRVRIARLFGLPRPKRIRKTLWETSKTGRFDTGEREAAKILGVSGMRGPAITIRAGGRRAVVKLSATIKSRMHLRTLIGYAIGLMPDREAKKLANDPSLSGFSRRQDCTTIIDTYGMPHDRPKSFGGLEELWPAALIGGGDKEGSGKRNQAFHLVVSAGTTADEDFYRFKRTVARFIAQTFDEWGYDSVTALHRERRKPHHAHVIVSAMRRVHLLDGPGADIALHGRSQTRLIFEPSGLSIDTLRVEFADAAEQEGLAVEGTRRIDDIENLVSVLSGEDALHTGWSRWRRPADPDIPRAVSALVREAPIWSDRYLRLILDENEILPNPSPKTWGIVKRLRSIFKTRDASAGDAPPPGPYPLTSDEQAVVEVLNRSERNAKKESVDENLELARRILHLADEAPNLAVWLISRAPRWFGTNRSFEMSTADIEFLRQLGDEANKKKDNNASEPGRSARQDVDVLEILRRMGLDDLAISRLTTAAIKKSRNRIVEALELLLSNVELAFLPDRQFDEIFDGLSRLIETVKNAPLPASNHTADAFKAVIDRTLDRLEVWEHRAAAAAPPQYPVHRNPVAVPTRLPTAVPERQIARTNEGTENSEINEHIRGHQSRRSGRER